MNEYKKIVEAKLDRRELYEQLAEECSELAQAALKCIRAEQLSNNVTPTPVYEAHANLFDEIVDVLIVLNCLGIKASTSDINNSPKWKRWAERLENENTKTN